MGFLSKYVNRILIFKFLRPKKGQKGKRKCFYYEKKQHYFKVSNLKFSCLLLKSKEIFIIRFVEEGLNLAFLVRLVGYQGM